MLQVGNQALTIHLPPPFEGSGIPLSYDVGFTILSLIVACLSMILAFSFIGLRLEKRRPEGGSIDGEDAPRRSGSEADFDLEQRGATSPVSGDDKPAMEEVELDAKDKRSSWHPRSGSLIPSKAAAIINLPRQRKQEEASEKAEADEDGGEFGTRPAKVSTAGIVKILAAGIIAGGGIAAMRESSLGAEPIAKLTFLLPLV